MMDDASWSSSPDQETTVPVMAGEEPSGQRPPPVGMAAKLAASVVLPGRGRRSDAIYRRPAKRLTASPLTAVVRRCHGSMTCGRSSMLAAGLCSSTVDTGRANTSEAVASGCCASQSTASPLAGRPSESTSTQSNRQPRSCSFAVTCSGIRLTRLAVIGQGQAMASTEWRPVRATDMGTTTWHATP